MSKWLWCGGVLLLLGAGAITLKICRTPQQPPMTLPHSGVYLRSPRPWTAPAQPAPTAAAPAPQVEATEIAHEPIVTRLEPVESAGDVVVPLPTTGGSAESEVAATHLPRPDQEARYMPYADDSEFTVLLFQARQLRAAAARDSTPSAMGWAGLVRWALGMHEHEMTGAEESEEPPLLDPVPPGHDHPPHCPYLGRCAYPGSHRYPPR